MIIKWVKDRLGITKLEKENDSLKKQIENHRIFVNNKISELKEYTRVDADIGFRGNNTIIITGVYKNKGYVRFYDLGNGEFERMIKELEYMKDHALIRNIDAPPNVRGIFNI